MYNLIIDLFIFNKYKPKHKPLQVVIWTVLKSSGCKTDGFIVGGVG
jgi:hypothetical protein